MTAALHRLKREKDEKRKTYPKVRNPKSEETFLPNEPISSESAMVEFETPTVSGQGQGRDSWRAKRIE